MLVISLFQPKWRVVYKVQSGKYTWIHIYLFICIYIYFLCWNVIHSYSFIYRTLCIDIYIKKYIKMFECSVYTMDFAYTIIRTLQYIFLQYIYVFGFIINIFKAEYSVHFYPHIKNLIMWINSTFFNMKCKKNT